MEICNLLGGHKIPLIFNVEINSVTCSLILVILFIPAYWYLTIPSGIPPGPMGLPLVGYLPFLGENPHLKFIELGKIYGSVFSFYLGCRLVVVLNDYKSIREAFIMQADNFAGRPIGFNLTFFRSSNNTKSVSMTDGSYWKDHRRFINRYLKDCGMGKCAIEEQIMDEIQSFIAVIKSKNGLPTNVTNIVGLSVLNIIAILTLGKSFKYDDKCFTAVKRLNDQIVQKSTVNFMLGFPCLKYVPMLEEFASRTMRKCLKTVRLMTVKVLDAGDKINVERTSYVNAFLDEKQKRQKDADNFSNDSLVQNIRTLMSAGTEPMSNSLLWAIIYMMLHQDVQEKAQREIDMIIGQDRVPTFLDRIRTPYLDATICEIQRIRTLLPINIPHRNREETTLFRHRIPKNTYILSNLFAVQMDPEFWNNPEKFKPERFLDKNGCIKKPEQFVVFSLGKRRCLGEPLARMELYLYMATMLQQVTFKTPPNHQLSTNGRLGISLRPKQVVTCAIPRK